MFWGGCHGDADGLACVRLGLRTERILKSIACLELVADLCCNSARCWMKIVMSDESSRAFGDVEWFCLGLFIISPAAATGGMGQVHNGLFVCFLEWFGVRLPVPGERGRACLSHLWKMPA